MTYTEKELEQIDKNLRLVVDYLTETYVNKLDCETDQICAFVEEYRLYGLYVNGDGNIIFSIGNTNTIINKIDDNNDRLRLLNGAECLAHWKELKHELKKKWHSRNEKRNMVTFGFTI